MPDLVTAGDLLRPAVKRGGGPIVESYFLKANAPDRREALWLKYTFLVPRAGRPPTASVWAIHFDGERNQRRAFKETWPLGSVKWEDESLGLHFGDCMLEKGLTQGRLKDDKKSVA